MSKSQTRKDSPLVVAAAALDEELRRYDALADEAKRATINSGKTLLRAVALVNESNEKSEIIQEKLRALVTQIEEARVRQVESLNALLQAAERAQARSEQHDALVKRFAALGDSARQVQTLAADLDTKRREGSNEGEILSGLGDVEAQISAVVAEADALATLAEEQDWADLHRQADAARQQILSIKNKLAAARRDAATRAPS